MVEHSDYIKPQVPWSGVCSLTFQLPRNPQEASKRSAVLACLNAACPYREKWKFNTWEGGYKFTVQNVLQQHGQHMLSSLRRCHLVPYWLFSCSNQLHTYQLKCRIVVIQSPMLQFHHLQQDLHGIKHQHSQTIFPSKIHCPWSNWIHHASLTRTSTNYLNPSSQHMCEALTFLLRG